MNRYRVGIYLRLSREDEKLGESGSISTQRDLLLNYIRDHNLVFVDEYVDDGVSGTTFDRPGFRRMIQDCEAKRINMIITKDTSRLGRDHIEFGYYVERYFPEHNIRYVAVSDGIDTFANNSSTDMLVFKSAFNDMYVRDISNKLRSSLYTKKRNGLFVGTYAPYGYKKRVGDIHLLDIDVEASLVVQRIFQLFVQGQGISKIADILTMEQVPTPSMTKKMNLGQKNLHYGVWSTRTIRDILTNPTYIGNLTQCRQKKINYKSHKRIHNKREDWIVSEGAVTPIISKDVFMLVQNMIESNQYHVSNRHTSELLLKGLIYCKECHHTIGFREYRQITKKYGEVTRIYGNCNYWVKRKKLNVCTPHSVNYTIIEDLVLGDLSNRILHFFKEDDVKNIVNNYILNKQRDNIHDKILELDKSIKVLQHKIDVSYQDKLDNTISLDMYKNVYHSLSMKMGDIVKSRDYLIHELNNLEDSEVKKLKYFNRIRDILEFRILSRAFISSLIDKIRIDEEKNIFVYYRFKL